MVTLQSYPIGNNKYLFSADLQVFNTEDQEVIETAASSLAPERYAALFSSACRTTRSIDFGPPRTDCRDTPFTVAWAQAQQLILAPD